jgi:hypothetical protein
MHSSPHAIDTVAQDICSMKLMMKFISNASSNIKFIPNMFVGQQYAFEYLLFRVVVSIYGVFLHDDAPTEWALVPRRR